MKKPKFPKFQPKNFKGGFGKRPNTPPIKLGAHLGSRLGTNLPKTPGDPSIEGDNPQGSIGPSQMGLGNMMAKSGFKRRF